MRWTVSKPCTMGGGRFVCWQDLGLVNTISLDLDRFSLRLLLWAHYMLDIGYAGILIIGRDYKVCVVSILDNDTM